MSYDFLETLERDPPASLSEGGNIISYAKFNLPGGL